MTYIPNASPDTIALGIKDGSKRRVPVEPEAIPAHLPYLYTFAQKGPLTAQLVGGAARNKMYGIDTWDRRKKFATHATRLSNIFVRAANAHYVQRVVPDDAAPPSRICVMADVLATTLKVYERNTDGTFKKDALGQPIATTEVVDGYSVIFSTEVIDNTSVAFGVAEIKPGIQVDTASGETSQRYPLFELEVSDQGSYGNNMGIRLWAPTTKSNTPINTRLVIREKAFPFTISCIERPDLESSSKLIPTLAAEQAVTMVLKPGCIDRAVDKQMYFGKHFIPKYRDISESAGKTPEFGPFGRLKVYQENIDSLLGKFYAAEQSFTETWSDFDGSADEMYRFNMFGGTSSSGQPYTSFVIKSDGANAVRFVETADIYANGGSDGTMTNEVFSKLVAKHVVDFADPNSRLQSRARYPLSRVYDTGFPLETKYALCNVLAIRKDIALTLVTHIHGEPPLSITDESAIAIALRTRAQMFPESEFYGTSTVRCVIVGRSAELLDELGEGHHSLVLDYAFKVAKMQGAGSGSWNMDEAYDISPKNQIELFDNSTINVDYAPTGVRVKDWDNGLVCAEYFDRRALYFPAPRTICDDDTSVLTSDITMMGCIAAQKAGDHARREFSGRSDLTNGQLATRIPARVDELLHGRFGSRFVFESEVTFTPADIARGYSWNLTIRIFAKNMKTVGVITVESMRADDLIAAGN